MLGDNTGSRALRSNTPTLRPDHWAHSAPMVSTLYTQRTPQGLAKKGTPVKLGPAVLLRLDGEAQRGQIVGTHNAKFYSIVPVRTSRNSCELQEVTSYKRRKHLIRGWLELGMSWRAVSGHVRSAARRLSFPISA
jgi:hypothetical protein